MVIQVFLSQIFVWISIIKNNEKYYFFEEIGWLIIFLINTAAHFYLYMGSYFIEKVFNINGFGMMGFQAILDRDYPITMGFLVIVVLIKLIANIISDIALATVDPRIRFK